MRLNPARGGSRSLLVVLAAIALGLSATRTILAQELAIPTVGDSPTALQLCLRAEDLRDGNPLEAARLVHRLLNEYPDRLVPADDGGIRFVPASERALALLRRSPAVRSEWQKTVAPALARAVEEQDDAALVRVAPLTIEGLRAALRQAQRELEAGRPSSALGWLRRIDPADLESLGTPRDRAFFRATGARAHRLAGDRIAAAREQALLLELAVAEPSIEPIATALTSEVDARASVTRVMAPIDTSSQWHRVWRLALPGSPFSRRYLNPMTGPLQSVPSAEQSADDGTLLTVLPLASDDRLFICEGQVVTSIDRLSRRVRWKRELGSREDTELVPIGDLSEMTLAGEVLLVLTGHGTVTRRTGEGRLVALDAETGDILWEQTPARLENSDPDNAEGLFPHGRPLVVDDVVIVMARKQTARLEGVATLIGFDLATGAPRWMTYLVGCGSRPMSTLRAFSSPVAGDGAIFVASSLGAIARVDAADGTVRWLDRFPVPVADVQSAPVPWETGGPALVSSGLLSIAPDGLSVLLLDASSGTILRSFLTGAGEPWGSPRVLRASTDGRFVLALGDDVALFDAEALDRPRWTLSSMAQAAGIPTARLLVRGRTDFADGLIDGRPAVVVPLIDRLLVVDAERGTIARAIETGRAGNAMLADGQVLLASHDRLECFMPFAGAEKAVRDWMARDPADPTRPMALLELGIQCAVPAMIFEGIATTAAAVDRSDDEVLRHELVDRVLTGSQEIELSDPDMARLLSTVRETARSAADQVACALAEGAWQMRQGRVPEAIEAWQRVLASPALREATLATMDANTPATALVMARFSEVIASNGPAPFASRERDAAAALRSLGAAATMDELLDCGQAWLGSEAGAEAIMRAADGLIAAGKPRDAFIEIAASLRARSRLAGVDRASRSLAEALQSIAITQHWNEAAGGELAALLDRALVAGASSADLQAVRESLRALVPSHPAVRSWPAIGPTPTGAVTAAGRLALLGAAAEAERPTDRVLLVERSEGPDARPSLVMRRGPELERLWSRPIEVDDPAVVRFGETIVLWQRGAGQEPSIVALGGDDGAEQWSIPSVAAIFDRSRLGSGPVVPRRTLRDGRVSSVSPAEIIPIRCDPWLILARRNGDVACIDLRDGSVRWRRDGLVEEIAGDTLSGQAPVAANALVLAVAGLRRSAEGVASQEVVLVDPARGDTIEIVPLPGEPDWISIAPGPLVLAAVRNEVLAVVPGRGWHWSLLDHRIGGSVPSLLAGDRKLIVSIRGSRRDEFVALDLLEGRIEGSRFAAPVRRSLARSNLRSLQRVGDAVVALAADRFTVFDLAGRVIGQDAIAVDRTFVALLPAQDVFVVIDPEATFAYQASPDRIAGSSSGAVMYQLSRRDGARLVVDPIIVPVGDRPDRWLLLDGMIVGSGTDRSTCVSMPAESAR